MSNGFQLIKLCRAKAAFLNMKKVLRFTFSVVIVVVLLLSNTQAQVNYANDFTGCEVLSTGSAGATCQGWTVPRGVLNGFTAISDMGYSSCGSGNPSARVFNVASNTAISVASVTSTTAVGVSNGGPVTLNFSYKVRTYPSGGIPNTSSSIIVYWSTVSAEGPWIAANRFQHVNSSTCLAAPVTNFTPPPGNLYIRLAASAVGGSLYFIFDNISITQGAPAACLPPSIPVVSDITAQSATVSFTAPVPAAASYDWQLRSRGNPDDGPQGLIETGTSSVASFNLTSLGDYTAYQLYVQSVCGTQKSVWQNANFKTLQQQPNVAAPCIEWQKRMGGTSSDQARTIQQNPDGGYIVSGTSASADGYPHENFGSNDIWVVRLTASGDTVWSRPFGSSGFDATYAGLPTSDNGFFIGGQAGAGDHYVHGFKGVRDFWALKLDANGDTAWTKTYGGSNQDIPWTALQTTDNGFIMAGSSSSLNGDVSGNHGGSDGWIIKLAANGDTVWTKSLGGSGEETIFSVKQTTDNGYIVAAASTSLDGDVWGNHGANDVWIVKLNASGDTVWTRSLGGTEDDYGLDLVQTSDGGYLAGGVSNSNNGDVAGHYGDNTHSDIWLVKLDAAGAIQWQRSLGGTGDESPADLFKGFSLDNTPDGGYLVGGTTESIDGDVSGNHSLAQDYWMVKLNAGGKTEWQKCLGGSTGDPGFCAKPTADGGYIITGAGRSTDGDLSAGNGNFDFWTVKLSSASCVLPLHLLSFHADKQGSSSLIKWATENELDVANFEIERSGDAIHFENIGTIAANNAAARQQYHFKDLQPLDHNNYYRLKMIDRDGTITYSNIALVYFDAATAITVYPNPAVNNLQVHVHLTASQPVHLRLADVYGRQVKQFIYKAQRGSNTYTLPVKELPAGIYQLQVIYSNDGNTQVKTFIKQ